MDSRIEKCISDIELYIDNCRYQTLSNKNIIVNKEQMDELIAELRLKAPDEIKRCQKMLKNQEAIIANAQARAEEIVAQAQVHTTELINEHQIMQQAYEEANAIINQANIQAQETVTQAEQQAQETVTQAEQQAQEIMDAAREYAANMQDAIIQYTDEKLDGIERLVVHAIDTTRARTENLLNSLQECYDIVKENRKELLPEEEPQEPEDIPEVQIENDML